MNKSIYLELDQVPPMLRGGYSGRKFEAVICDSVSLQNTYWSGGTRSSYAVIELDTGKSSPIANNSAPPQFGIDYDGETITLKPGYAVVEHSIFCGKDMGLTFYIHTDNAGKFLPDSSGNDLTDAELCLLDATAGLKSSYGGRKPRIDMMKRNGFTDEQIEQAKQSLISKKMLNSRGAITTLGRNNRPERNKFKNY